MFAHLIQSLTHKGEGLGPLRRKVKANIVAMAQREDMSLSSPAWRALQDGAVRGGQLHRPVCGAVRGLSLPAGTRPDQELHQLHQGLWRWSVCISAVFGLTGSEHRRGFNMWPNVLVYCTLLMDFCECSYLCDPGYIFKGSVHHFFLFFLKILFGILAFMDRRV